MTAVESKSTYRTTLVSLGLFCSLAIVLLLVASANLLSAREFDATITALYVQAELEWAVGTGGPPPPTPTPYPSATFYPTATLYPTATPYPTGSTCPNGSP